MNTTSYEKFQADLPVTRAQYERSFAILGGMGMGCTPSFLCTCYPRASRDLTANFVRDVGKFSIDQVLALFVTFGQDVIFVTFVRGPVVVFSQALADLSLDGLLTLITMT